MRTEQRARGGKVALFIIVISILVVGVLFKVDIRENHSLQPAMASDNKYLLVDAGSAPFVSGKDEVVAKFWDYYDKFLGPPVGEHIGSVYFGGDLQTPREVLETGYMTSGQWLLWVVAEFYGETTNGSISQFLLNKEEFIADVEIALRFLELNEFAEKYVNLVDPIYDDLSKNRRAAIGASEDVRYQAFEKDRYAIRKMVDESAVAGEINEHFVMKWNEELGTLVWLPEQWSHQMLALTVAYIESHPSEFQHIRN